MTTNRRSLKKTFLAATLIIGQALAMPMLPAFAADSSVRIAGQIVLNDIQEAGGLSGDTRADKIQENLDNALVATKNKGNRDVGVSYVNGMPVVTLGGYHVATVDSATAKAAGVTPALLAQKWITAMNQVLSDQASINAYVSHLSGDFEQSAPSVTQAPPQSYSQPASSYNQTPSASHPYSNPRQPVYGQPHGGTTSFNTQPHPYYAQGRVVHAPAGMVIPATLSTSISSELARPGDVIQANVSRAIILGNSQIPVGTVLLGQVTTSSNARFLGRTGTLNITFNRMRTPDGTETPISAHIMGGVNKYKPVNDGTLRGETWKGKVVQAGVRSLVGAGTGAALGTAVGAIAGGGRGAGRGAWSGTAIGAGVGLAQSLLLRKGQNVTIPSGTAIELQLDAPVTLAGSPSTALQNPIAYGGYSQ